jgi:hypothetical protein
MNGGHHGKIGKAHQGLNQNRPIAQFQILFFGIATDPAAATRGRDQNVNMHNFTRNASSCRAAARTVTFIAFAGIWK